MGAGWDALRRMAAGGAKSVAGILNTMDPAAREEVLASIEEEDPALADEIRSLMFVFEDLAGLDVRSLREVLRETDQARLALALRGTDESVLESFLRAMSAGRAAMVRDDMLAMGPQRAEDVETARKEITAAARRLEAAGRIVLRPGAGDVYI